MAELAQVIVDVPTMQTNRPYTYQVPKRLEHQIGVGMRVVVPFGRGNRKVQGFVVGVDSPSNYDGELKPIDALMDLTPAINPELMKLSSWLADQTYSFRISCLYLMLPNVMKAKTTRIVKVNGHLNDEDQYGLFHGKNELDFASVQNDPQAVSRLMKLRREGKVSLQYVVSDRARAKTITAIKAVLSADDYRDTLLKIPKNAKAQAKLLNYLVTIGNKPIPLKAARQKSGLSDATFRTGEKKGWLKKVAMEVLRTPGQNMPNDDQAHTEPLKLNQEQAAAVSAIDDSIKKQESQTYLLEGVTGSGKTEVYLQSIAAALKQGRSALMLVPEISLTPQIVSRVKSRFGSTVAVLHSGLSNGERYDEWRRIESGKAKVVVGARSSIFAPLKNIGLIVMDEEHESSYKQDDSPRYHAREVAKWRSCYHHCPLVLGSATPSLESRARAMKGVYKRLTLKHRVNQRPLPPIQVVDMRPEVKKSGDTNFSQTLVSQLRDRINRHEQSILMLNRRGFSSFMMCRDCGFVLKCPNCDISLTLHMATRSMKCHYCGHEEPIPKFCPKCGSRHIRYYGTGTEQAESELHHLLPEAKVIRMDVDTTRRKGMHEKLLDEFGQHKADILLGTQMIAKGLDFPDVTLVGVLNADMGLGLPDFRASERTFDLLCQVSGRAGRADKEGAVVIQTFNPDNYAIRLAQHQDYEKFFRVEMGLRHRGGYPPYYYTVRVMVSHPEERQAAAAITAIRGQLSDGLAPSTVILGPTPRAIARVKRRYYYQLVIKYKHDPALHQLLTQISQQTQSKGFDDVHVAIDPEPQYFM